MDSPSSVYSDEAPLSPAVSSLQLPSPVLTAGIRSIGRSPPPAQRPGKKVLKSMITDEEFRLGSPRDSLMARRRIFDRKTNKGEQCDPDGWQGDIPNQLRFREQMALNKQWRQQQGVPLHGPDIFKPIDWNKPTTRRDSDVPISPRTIPVRPAETTSVETGVLASVTWSSPPEQVEQSSSRRDAFDDSKLTETNITKYEEADSPGQTPSSMHCSLSLLVPKSAITGARKSIAEVTGINDAASNPSSQSFAPVRPAASPNPTVKSTASLARFLEAEAPRLIDLTTTSDSDHCPLNDDNMVVEEARIAIPIAMPVPVPVRGPSLLNLRVLETGVTSRSRRPVIEDSFESENDDSSLTADHSSLMPTTLEIGTARAVTITRTPPVKLVVVGGRNVALGQPESEDVHVPWDNTEALKQLEGHGHGHLWPRLKRKFHRD